MTTAPTAAAPLHPIDVAREEMANVICGLELFAAVLPEHAPALRKTCVRLQRARSELDSLCRDCGGTILPPTIGGVPRGTCRCAANLHRQRVVDWGSARLNLGGREP